MNIWNNLYNLPVLTSSEVCKVLILISLMPSNKQLFYKWRTNTFPPYCCHHSQLLFWYAAQILLLFFLWVQQTNRTVHSWGEHYCKRPTNPLRDKGLDLLIQQHLDKGVCSFHVIYGTFPVVATPNASLCSITGQRMHKCFVSCCMRMFVSQGSSVIPAKQIFLDALEQWTIYERCSSLRYCAKTANKNKY